MQIQWVYGAALAELGAFMSPLAQSSSAYAMLSLATIHTVAAGLSAFAVFPLLPEHYRRDKAPALGLLFALGFMAPVIGPLTTVLMVRLGLLRQKEGENDLPPRILDMPEYDLRTRDPRQSSRGAIRARLAKHVPEHLRMQSLLTLQAVPDRVANPILEELLADEIDDIRLVAFGMLDAKEKILSRHILKERTHLARATDPAERSISQRNLAELHWELIYASLAQGELRQQMLETALRYATDAARHEASATDPGLALLQGRILLTLEREDEADAAFARSLELGQPAASVLPYRAELLYRRRQYAAVRATMAGLVAYQLAPRVATLTDLWTGRDSPRRYHDRRVFRHI